MDQQPLSPLAVVTICLSLLPLGVCATEEFNQAGIWLGIDIGGGKVKTSANGIDENESAFYLGFKAHYRVEPNYLIGLELSGWTLESGNLSNPAKGEAISQMLFVTQYYPAIDSGLFLKAGAGYASYWNNQPGEPGRKNGSGFMIGAGYDYPVHSDWTLTPFVTYGVERIAGEAYRAWATGAGLAYGF